MRNCLFLAFELQLKTVKNQDRLKEAKDSSSFGRSGRVRTPFWNMSGIFKVII